MHLRSGTKLRKFTYCTNIHMIRPHVCVLFFAQPTVYFLAHFCPVVFSAIWENGLAKIKQS
jgi:hypothetical protein